MRSQQPLVTSIILYPYRGDHPVVLLGVRPAVASESRGVRLRYAASIDQRAHIGSARGSRSRAWGLQPLAGFAIPNGAQGAVVIGMSARGRGVFFVHAFVVDYRIGRKHYHALFHQGIEICVGRRTCPP